MSVQQSSQRAAINWQSFNIGSGATVNFQQPSSSAVTLNRVVGTERSVIDGALNANGNVYILNANGVLFNRSAQVNVGGLVASTLNISDADFLAGKTTFESNGSRGSVINLGTLTAANAGHIALLGQHVANEGVINATLGTAVLAAGDKVSLNFNGNSLVGVTVDRGTLNALVENKQAIIADGGLVTLTAKGLDQVMQTVVNNTGEIRAQTIQNKDGKIYLLGGMQHDRIEVGGKLDASALNSGNGGFVETSAANVQIKDDLHVTTQAARGRTGTWLIDPNDYTVAASGGNITGAALGTQLGTNNVEISTAVSGTSGGNGDIFVNDNITWSSGNRLTLTAERNIKINATIDASGGSGGAVTLKYGQGSVATGNAATYDFGLTSTGFAGRINLQAGQNFTTKLGSDGTPINWTVITQLGSAGDETQAGASNSLQGLAENSRLAGNFVLGADINASATVGWNSGQGFKPIGDSTTRFTGGFDGLGHTVDGLTINATGQPGINVGLFGAVGNTTLKNLGFSNIDIRTGLGSVGTGSGSLAGEALNTHIENIILMGHADTNNFTLKREGVTEFAQPFENFGGVVGIYKIDNSSNSSIGIRNVRVNAKFTLGFEGYPLSSDWGFFRYIGGVVGRGFSDFVTPVNISNASFNGSIISNTQLGFNEVGGIIGIGNYLVLNDATVQADILNRENINWTSRFVGGAVGSLNPPGNGKRHTISRVSVSGAIRATEDVGGMLGAVNDADISNSHSSAVITNPYSNQKAGGLVGYGLNLSINQSSASGDVTGGSSKIGGLVGQLSTSSVIGSFATGNVSTSQSDSRAAMGGLIGEAAREVTVSNSFATGSVLPRQTNPGNAGRVGGLIGEINLGVVGGQTLIENSYATGRVGMPQRAFGDGVGGLIGLVTGQSTASVSVSNSSFRGAGVHGRDQVGGLVGRVEINTQINNGYSDANVVGRDNVGGLIGAITWRQSGQNHLIGINRSRSSGVITGRDYVGGLLGKAANVNISESFATGNVSGQNHVGGFAGEIATAYQDTTNYTDVYGIDPAYPAVASSVKNSYATGSVSATGSKSGGFTGSLYYGTLENVYAAGAVTGTSDVGGLVGTATYDTPVGEQYGTYYGNGQPVACSTIPAGSCYYQYFQQTGTQATLANNLVAGGFWDVEISGLGTINSTTGSAGGVGKSTNQMQRTTLFSNAGWSVTTPIPGAQSPTLLWLNGQNSPVWQTYSAPISIVGTSVASKEYDGNTNASVTAGTLNGIASGDAVSVSIVSASFANANAGSGKPVAVSYSLGGANASDYHLPAGSVTGTITPKTLTVNPDWVFANDKPYDGTTATTVDILIGPGQGNVSGLVGSETVGVSGTGAFATANAGFNKPVTVNFTLTDGQNGGLASNYSMASAQMTSLIRKKDITVAGNFSANHKVYDGTTAATFATNELALTGVVQGEALNLSGLTLSFSNKNVGTNKTVTLGGGVITNTNTGSASNYNFTLGERPPTRPANITAKPLTVMGTTVANKAYDGNTNATVSPGTLGGLVGDETLDVAAAGELDNPNPGLRTALVRYTLSNGSNGGLASNYSLADTSGLTATVIQDSAVTNAAASIATPRLLTPESGQTGGKTSDVLLPASYVVNTAARINAGTAQSAPGNVVAVPPTVSLPFAQGEPLAVLSTPKSDEPTTAVTLSQARVMTGGQGSGVSDGTREVRVPVSRNSLAEIVNGGLKLPGGVEQQLFVVRK